MTNGEKLRAMSDEELGRFICEEIALECYECPGKDLCICDGGKANGLMKWLESEAKDE